MTPGNAVSRLQEQLEVDADGTFGKSTEAALEKWQKANGIKADGIAGPDTLCELGLDDLVTLAAGDRGNLVRQLQEALDIKPDGKFGDATAAAVEDWQRRNGHDVDGLAGSDMLIALGILTEEAVREAAAVGGADAAATADDEPAPGPIVTGKARSPTAGTGGGRAITTWAYQLHGIDPDEIAKLPVDLMVVDYSREGDEAGAFTPADLANMKRRPDGGSQEGDLLHEHRGGGGLSLLLAAGWGKPATKPAWLDDENPAWEGNYKVRYWDPAWKAVIFGSANAYLDKIIAAGFDGVYLDIVDGFEYWRDEKKERADADREMIRFVTELATYARRKRPDFWIVPQNGEALLEDAGYRRVISAQAKEDLFYGLGGDGKANKKGDVGECLDCLAPARDAGIPILVVEYLDDDKKIDAARDKIAAAGCAAYFAPRDLGDVPTEQFGD